MILKNETVLQNSVNNLLWDFVWDSVGLAVFDTVRKFIAPPLRKTTAVIFIEEKLITYDFKK